MSAALLREVRLYGPLGRQFGRLFRLAVATPAEAVHALSVQLAGFRRAFLGADGRARYHVFVGRREQRRDIGEEDVDAPIGAAEPIRIVPAIAGAKRAGALQSIIGTALILYGTFGQAYGGGPWAQQLGASLLLGGVVQLLSPQRNKKDERQEGIPSYAYDGPVNNSEQGGPVPLVFGRVICGSTVVSQGFSSDVVYIEPPAPLEPVDFVPGYEAGGPSG